jgi:TP901 family phage tail tape measure protein
MSQQVRTGQTDWSIRLWAYDSAGAAVTGFNQKLGLTGQPLQQLSEQALELSRITGTELAGNVESITNVMQNFGVSAGDQSGKLDLLFRASQASGVSVADLSSQMSGAGVVLRSVGLDFNQSAAFLATLGKAGVDAADVMPALSRTLATAAKSGKDATTVFNETFDAIKNAPTDVEVIYSDNLLSTPIDMVVVDNLQFHIQQFDYSLLIKMESLYIYL